MLAHARAELVPRERGPRVFLKTLHRIGMSRFESEDEGLREALRTLSTSGGSVASDT